MGYRNITNAKGCDIMKKVGPLRRICIQFVCGCFDNRPDPANVIPAHGNSQPPISRSPSTRTDQEIFPGFRHKLLVDIADL